MKLGGGESPAGNVFLTLRVRLIITLQRDGYLGRLFVPRPAVYSDTIQLRAGRGTCNVDRAGDTARRQGAIRSKSLTSPT